MVVVKGRFVVGEAVGDEVGEAMMDVDREMTDCRFWS